MKILLLTQVVPNPPDSGPKIKTNAVLRYLARRHEVHLVSFVRSDAEAAAAHALAPLCSGVTTVPLRRSRWSDVRHEARSLLGGRPFLIERDDSRAMRQALAALCAVGSFDAVHADQLSMAQFGIDLPVPWKVLDEHNAVWTIVRRSAAGAPLPVRVLAEIEWRKLRRYEGGVCQQFDRVTVVSDEDRHALETAAGGPFVAATIPIAIDAKDLVFLQREADARHVVSVATMFYPPNVDGIVWFAQKAFPRVRETLPGTRFYIVGSRPPESVTSLASETNGVIVTGYLNDLDPVLRRAAVLVVPLRSGSGMRVKILEAFARGIPVVSTSVGVEGIAARSGEHLLVADDPAAFADAVVRILREPELGARLARAGRALAEARYDWRTALSGLDMVYSPPVAESGRQLVGAGR